MDGKRKAPWWREDWFLLPLTSLLTILLILVPTELISRLAFSASEAPSLRCMVLDDPAGVRAIPNCTCLYKIPEGGVVQYKFNSCGYRAAVACGPKPQGTFRIVLVGTSMAEGLHVPEEQSLAARLPKELARMTGRKIDLYNEALEWETPHRIDLHFQDAVAVEPDMILWAVNKWDVENASLTSPASAKMALTRSGRTWARVADAFHRKTISQLASEGWNYAMRTALPGTSFLVQHLLSKSPDEYVEQYIRGGDESEFLAQNPSAAWRQKLGEFDAYVADVERQAKLAGIRVVAAVLPTRAEATLISIGKWPAGLDPYKFGEEVRSVFERHEGIYIDLLHALSDVPDSDQFYYPLDGHPNAGGQAIFADLLAKGLAGHCPGCLQRHTKAPGQLAVAPPEWTSHPTRIATGQARRSGRKKPARHGTGRALT